MSALTRSGLDRDGIHDVASLMPSSGRVASTTISVPEGGFYVANGRTACIQCYKPLSPVDKRNQRRYCSALCKAAAKVANRRQWFWDRVTTSEQCWEWQGYRTATGYGRTGFQDDEIYAHRFSWTIHNGPIPNGMDICHHCDNRSCVRPDHLFLGTRLSNMRDAINKERMWYQNLPANTQVENWTGGTCKKGHPFDDNNTQLRNKQQRPRRICRTCAVASRRRYNARKRSPRGEAS